MLTDDSQIRELQTATSAGLGNLSMDVVTAITNLYTALYFSPQLTLVILAATLPSLLVIHILGQKIQRALQLQKEESLSASKHAVSAISAIDLVKTFGGTDQEVWQYSNTIKRAMTVFIEQSRASAFQISFVKFWLETMFVAGFYYGAVLVTQGTHAGDVVTTFYAALGALQAMESFIPLYRTVWKGMFAGKELQSILNSKVGYNDTKPAERHKPSRCQGGLAFRNVSI